MPHNASAPPIPSSGVETSMPVTDTAVAKIGPNALTQTVRALRERVPEATVVAILQQCHQESLLSESPMEMVEERAFAALVAAVADQLGVPQAQQILWRAGTLTALYLLEHRIPRPLQWFLRPLPPRAALALFLLAIRQHAWTFVGSGQFTYRVRNTPRLTVSTYIQPTEAVCGFYGGTFEHLFRTLVASQTRVEITISTVDRTLTDRKSAGQVACIYTIHFQR